MRVGIIGAGIQGKRRAQALKQCGDELVIVADTYLEQAKLLADEMGCEATDDWKQVMARGNVETIVVCTPPNLHLPISIAAINRGKHILCEKPLALNPEEARKIVDAACENGARLKCGFNLRHHLGIQKAREWLAQGVIGELSFIRCRYGIGGRPEYEKEWRAKVEISGGGQLMDQGQHVIDLSRWFLGEFSQVFGFLSTFFWDIAPLEDNAFVLLRTEKGQVASLHVSGTQWKNFFSFELFGQDGYIAIEGLGGSYGMERAILGKRAFLEPFQEQIVEFRGEDPSWREEWREFISAINENREPLGNGYDGLQALRLAYATYESAHKGCLVKLDSNM